MSEKRSEALLVTPLPPLETGLATYAERVLRHTAGFIDWTVAYPGEADTAGLPQGPEYVPIEDICDMEIPDRRIFQIGNSPHCFPVVRLLYRIGGTALFHETVLHHMLRHCYLERGMLDEYRRELVFCYGPGAFKVEETLSRKLPEAAYDALLKRYPLAGRAVQASRSAVCLNEYAASGLRSCYHPGAVIIIGHPLSPLPEIFQKEKPFSPCIGMVGGFHYGRNIEVVLEGMEMLREHEPGAGLLIIGGGYPSEMPEWVRVTGRLPEEEYQSWIRTLDLVLDLRHPTCGETSGSLLEAMRAGVPAVVSASGSFNNLPSEGVIRLPPENMAHALPKACMMVLEDDDLRKRMTEVSIHYAEETGSVERLLEDWKSIMHLSEERAPVQEPRGSGTSLAAAWSEPPPGFVRDTCTGPVTWRFGGSATIIGPDGVSGGFLTAFGSGTVNGIRLSREMSVLQFEGRDLEFSGEGAVSSVHWN